MCTRQMAPILDPLPTHVLLDLLDPATHAAPPTDAEGEQAISNFIAHLKSIEGVQKRTKWSEQYMIEKVFGRTRSFKNDTEAQQYCRTHLSVAIQQLDILIKELREVGGGKLTMASLSKWRDTIIDYVYDLAQIVPFLQRKVEGYVYLRGGKNPTVHSWEVYNLAKGLAYQTVHWGQGGAFDHKTSQIAAIGVLRQALELRFDRLVAVYPTDVNGKSPKLRHGFHQEFIINNPCFFQPDGFSIAELKPMYDWCSEIVHQAYQPFAWQISWAITLAGRLLGPRPATKGAAWSIANGVEVLDVEAMQATFETHFLDTYEHGAWRISRERPEALVRGWTEAMASTGADYRPVSKLAQADPTKP